MVRWLLSLTLILLLTVESAVSAATEPSKANAGAVSAPPEAAPEEDDSKDVPDEAEEKKESEESSSDEDESSSDEKDKKSEEEEADAAEESASDADEDKSDTKKAEKKADEKDADADEDEADKKDDAKKDAKTEAKSAAKEKTGDKAAEKPAEEKKPATVKVKAKDLKIEVEAEGVFVAEEAEEVALRPEVWSSFKVLESVPHGKRVRKGDVLVKFDEKDIDEAIEEKDLAQRLGELALMEAEEEFPRTERSIELNYDQAKREYDQAKDEYDRFQKQMREMSEKLAEYYLKSAEQDFESAQEELDQLVKMYEADELTEETEEIVLRRQKFQVEAAKFFVDYSKINHDYTMTVSIPRRDEMLKTAVEMAKIEFERAKMAKSLGMNQQRYELQSLRETRARSVESHAELVKDRDLMVLKSPEDGIAYYGRQVNGRWIEVSTMEQKLVPFGSVTPNSVVMTIIKDRPMYVETSIGEKELPTVKSEQDVTVTPAADSEVELKGGVQKVATVPGGGNKFTVRVELKSDKTPEWLMPGMTGKVKITTYDVKDAVVIAADLVQSDEDDPKKKYVMVQVEDEDKPVRRELKLGKTKDKEVEVLKGLKEGDEIVKGAKDKAADEDADEDEDKDTEKSKDAEKADEK